MRLLCNTVYPPNVYVVLVFTKFDDKIREETHRFLDSLGTYSKMDIRVANKRDEKLIVLFVN